VSTRCQIGFYYENKSRLSNFEALLYRHCDGYPQGPSGVLATIIPHLLDFDKNRGLDDPEYAAAWLCAKLKDGYTNIGISKDFHGDIAYYYAIRPNGTIEIWRCNRGNPTESAGEVSIHDDNWKKNFLKEESVPKPS